uniref:Aegyptin 2 n=1 Tax=Ochlerotatus triseriatus TaxID=7162 RepID=C6ZQU0_OCHTR
MKPLLKLFVAFCLLNFALSRPFPEGDEGAEDGGEEDKEETGDDAGGEDAGDDEDKPDDAAGDDAGGEDAEEGTADGDDAKQEDGEGGEGGDDEAGSDDAGGEDAGGDNAGDDKEGSPESGGAKDDRVNTYNQVSGLMDKETKVDQIESTYLRPALDNDLQAGLRNPVIDAIGTVGDYSKISSCFKSMGSDVKKVIDQETKSFKACMSKKDASEYTCSEESSKKAREQFTQIGSKIVSCVSSKKN